MHHFPILQTDAPDGILHFSHFHHDAPAGLWKKENVILLNHVKINVFVEGSFSVFSDKTLHAPIRGDVCCFPPRKMHYGQILRPMHIEYYQLDIGRAVFEAIPDGDRLLARLTDATEQKDSFLRPSAERREQVLTLCAAITDAVRDGARFLAYAKIIELLSVLAELYHSASTITGVSYSLRTAQALRYLEEHHSEAVTVETVACELGVSASFLCRTFKREIGVTLHDYLNQYRILQSIEHLKTKSVTECAYLCGFCDTSHFISVFKKHMKITPMQYKITHVQSHT